MFRSVHKKVQTTLKLHFRISLCVCVCVLVVDFSFGTSGVRIISTAPQGARVLIMDIEQSKFMLVPIDGLHRLQVCNNINKSEALPDMESFVVDFFVLKNDYKSE